MNINDPIRLRADKTLQREFPGLTRSQIEEAIQEGLVTLLDGKRVKKGDPVLLKELSLGALHMHLEALRQGSADLVVEVILDRSDFLIIDKPVGMPSQPLSLFDSHTVTHWAFSYLPELKNEFKEIQPELTPHRLDIDTSGLIIVCKTQQAYLRFRIFFKENKIKKKYLAWCWGKTSVDVFNINYPIAHDPKYRSKMMVLLGDEKYRAPIMEAETRVKLIKQSQDKEKVLFEIECQTGVTHQVRVHLSAMGFPLVGDKLYDVNFDKRSSNVNQHLLRAVFVEGAEFSCGLNSDTFENLF